jgi:phage-related minor tail protein
MDLQQLQATRAQLIYEFGEIEYERRLHFERIKFLDDEYNRKVSELQQIETEIEKFSEKTSENILKTE